MLNADLDFESPMPLDPHYGQKIGEDSRLHFTQGNPTRAMACCCLDLMFFNCRQNVDRPILWYFGDSKYYPIGFDGITSDPLSILQVRDEHLRRN